MSMAWGPHMESFDLKTPTRVTVHLRTSGSEPGELWIDGVMLSSGGGPK